MAMTTVETRGGRGGPRVASREGVGVHRARRRPRALSLTVIVSLCVASASALALAFARESAGISDVSDVDDAVIRAGDVAAADEVASTTSHDAPACVADGVAALSTLEEFRYVLLARTSANEDMCRCFPTWSRGVGAAEEARRGESDVKKTKKEPRAPLLSLKEYKENMEEKMAQKQREKEAKQREKEEKERKRKKEEDEALRRLVEVNVTHGAVSVNEDAQTKGETLEPNSTETTTVDEEPAPSEVLVEVEGGQPQTETMDGASTAETGELARDATSETSQAAPAPVEPPVMEEEDTDGEATLAELVIKPERLTEADAEMYNYAASFNGAKVVASDKDSKHASAALKEDKDVYYISPCASEKFLTVELSEEVTVTSLVLGNFEFHSSRVKDFEVWGTDGHHAIEEGWKRLMTGRADNTQNYQKFAVPSPAWVRYVQIRMTGHHDQQHFCTLSLLRIHGKDAKETLKEEMERLQAEVQEVESLLSDEDEDEDEDKDVDVREESSAEVVLDVEEQSREDTNASAVVSEENAPGERASTGDDGDVSTSRETDHSANVNASLAEGAPSETTSNSDEDDNAAQERATKIDASTETSRPNATAAGVAAVNATNVNATGVATAKPRFATSTNELAKGGGDANVFRLLAQKIKDLELNQSLLSRYVESLNVRYGETLEDFGKEIDEIEESVSNSTEKLDEASRKARASSKACDDAVARVNESSEKLVAAAVSELDAYRTTVAKRDTVLALALALTAGALVASRRSSGAIERVLSALSSFALLVIVVANIVLIAQNFLLKSM